MLALVVVEEEMVNVSSAYDGVAHHQVVRLLSCYVRKVRRGAARHPLIQQTAIESRATMSAGTSVGS